MTDIFNYEETDDPRQKKSMALINALAGKIEVEEGEKPVLNNKNNVFRASCVDLGWLKDNLELLIKKGDIKTTEDVCNFIGDSVQRFKRFEIKDGRAKAFSEMGFGEDNTLWFVKISTKDDYGWYDYGFYLDGKLENNSEQ